MSCRVHSFPPISFWVPPKPFQKLQNVCVSGTMSRTTTALPSLNPLALRAVKRRLLAFCVTASSGEKGGGWKARWNPPEMVGENVLRLIAGATASPIAQFVPAPTTFLHSLDPRVKLVWLLTLVVLPARSHVVMRVGIVVYLSLLSILTLPKQIWKDQLGRVFFLSGVLFLMLALGSDGVPPLVQSRSPPASVTGLPSLPMSLDGYSYSIIKLGPLQLTRKGLSVATTAACLSFTVFQSASLCLATTMPEQLASAFRWFMMPLECVGVPVSEMILTLLLSLRFITIVFDEVRNAALGIVARGINWKSLTFMETLDVFAMYIRRIFTNIFSHADQISQAMIVRGFRGNSRTHKLYCLSSSSFGLCDAVSVVCLLALVAAAILTEHFLV
ncbi:protein ABCI12, chloroplastic [Nymphaea colorata]|nr:protein ABCI12, chloroplastic [Nymphaea colorata]XP_031500462.1 protein ABCI12, chloroplastic [Nymphaea colorata]